MTNNISALNAQISTLQQKSARSTAAPAPSPSSQTAPKPTPQPSQPQPSPPHHPPPPPRAEQYVGQKRPIFNNRVAKSLPLQGQPHSFMTQGFLWFWNQIDRLHPDQLDAWLKVINVGRWGPLESASGIPFIVSTRKQDPSLESRKHFIRLAIFRAFAHGSYGFFPVPPEFPIPGLVNPTNYSWNIFNGLNDYLMDPATEFEGFRFPPGTNMKRRPTNQPQSAPPPLQPFHVAPHPASAQPTSHPAPNASQEVYYEDLYGSDQPGPPALAFHTVQHGKGGKGKNSVPQPRSFASAATSAPLQPPHSAPRPPAQRQSALPTDRWVLNFIGMSPSSVTDNQFVRQKPNKAEIGRAHV